MDKRTFLLGCVVLFCAVGTASGSVQAEKRKRKVFIECMRNCGGQSLRRGGAVQLKVNDRFFGKKISRLRRARLAGLFPVELWGERFFLRVTRLSKPQVDTGGGSVRGFRIRGRLLNRRYQRVGSFSFVQHETDKTNYVGHILLENGEDYRIFLGSGEEGLLERELANDIDCGVRSANRGLGARVRLLRSNSMSMESVDLLVLYTDLVEQNFEDFMLRIDESTDQTNEAFGQSEAHVLLDKVHVRKVNYVEHFDSSKSSQQSSLEVDLWRLTQAVDPTFNCNCIGCEECPASLGEGAGMEGLESVRALRELYGADLVVLLNGHLNTPGVPAEQNIAHCGFAWMPTMASVAANKLRGLSVVAAACANHPQKFSFAHEIGHNLGADHDQVEQNEGPHVSLDAFSHHWSGYRSLMSLMPRVSYDRVLYFSNPEVLHTLTGLSTGTSQRNNAEALNTMRSETADFYTPGPVLGDMNGDNTLTMVDVNLFFEALTNRAAYDERGFLVDVNISGDVNQDGTFDVGDSSALNALPFSG